MKETLTDIPCHEIDDSEKEYFMAVRESYAMKNVGDLKTVEEVKEYLTERFGEDESIIVFENPGYPTAFIGVTYDNGYYRAVYDHELMIESLMVEDGMTMEDAMEFIDFNTLRALSYAGGGGPIVLEVMRG